MREFVFEPILEGSTKLRESVTENNLLDISNKVRGHRGGDVVVMIDMRVSNDHMDPHTASMSVKPGLEQVCDVAGFGILKVFGSHVHNHNILAVGALDDIRVPLSHGNSKESEVASLTEGEGCQEER